MPVHEIVSHSALGLIGEKLPEYNNPDFLGKKCIRWSLLQLN